VGESSGHCVIIIRASNEENVLLGPVQSRMLGSGMVMSSYPGTASTSGRISVPPVSGLRLEHMINACG